VPPRERRPDPLVSLTPTALADLTYWAGTNARVVLKIFSLLEECRRDPFRGMGKPEPLKRLGPNIWSRRIDEANRLVYRVEEQQIVVLRARTHYE
jgi:toxin YoeB